MRGMIRRGLRLELVAGLSTALALSVAASGLPALAFAEQATATQTTLSVETHDQAGRTKASVSVSVTGDDGLPANGVIALIDRGQARGSRDDHLIARKRYRSDTCRRHRAKRKTVRPEK